MIRVDNVNRWLRKLLKKALVWTGIILLAVVVATALRVFFWCSFLVPSHSMIPTIEPGDFIMVNKQIPGPRVYHNLKNITENGKVKTKRFKGIRKIRKNDIIVFNSPYGDRDNIKMNPEINYVKRCVATPGDTFMIENGIYIVTNAVGMELGDINTQKKLKETLQNNKNDPQILLFPFDTLNYNWTMREFGPLYIPKAGDLINLDTANYILYKKIIEYETDMVLKPENGNVFLADSVIHNYTFRMNYYFMAGDYIFDSVDSRYWGLLPEDHIIGKAIMVWKSVDVTTQKFRWKRFFKLL
jgi:signal peptidase I